MRREKTPGTVPTPTFLCDLLFFSEKREYMTKKIQKKIGRPSKFTKDRKERIIKAIQAGCTYEMAADYAGVSRKTLWTWIQKAEQETDKNYETFLHDLKKAEIDGAITHLGNIQQASVKDWKASAWMLERRHGYSKDRVHKTQDETVEHLPKDTLEILRQQANDLKRGMTKAEQSESWQAYAALQRQLLQVIQQIKQIEAEQGMQSEMDGLTDDQLVQEITNAIISLPPILRQRLENDISNITNVIAFKQKTVNAQEEYSEESDD